MVEHFQNILAANAAFRVRLGILAQVGALWALARTNQGQQDHSDIRYREVSKMLEAEAESVRAQAEADLAGGAAGGGHGHGDCPPGEHPHIFPLHKMKPWKQGDDFLHRCRVGVLQYVAWQSFSALFAFIMEKNHNFHEGSFSPSHGYIYVLVIKSFSQAWALYCLVYFEHSCAKLLEPVKPMPKFWSIESNRLHSGTLRFLSSGEAQCAPCLKPPPARNTGRFRFEWCPVAIPQPNRTIV